MNIVLLDDERVSLAFLHSHVAKLGGHSPIAFSRPTEALEWCARNEPDLVIVDYLMPEMDGIAFAEHFRLLPEKAEIPMLMVTGARDAVVRHRALTSGINDFLNKPVDVIELGARLKNMLALRASQKHLEQRARELADEASKNARAALEIAARERETLMFLSLAAERRRPDTHEHCMRLSLYAQLIGQRMGLGAEDAEMLRLAAPLHDVGELRIPDRILLKPGMLTDGEWDVMKQHTVIGAEILNQSQSPILRTGAEIALSHHEKWDGSGYPYGLAGDAIPLFGRIVAVADVFDALTSAKPYRHAWDLDRALSMMKDGTGKHLAPDCMHAFFESIDEVLAIRAQHADNAAAPLGAAA